MALAIPNPCGIKKIKPFQVAWKHFFCEEFTFWNSYKTPIKIW